MQESIAEQDEQPYRIREAAERIREQLREVRSINAELDAVVNAKFSLLLDVLEALWRDVDAINDIDDLLVMANRTGWGARVTPTLAAAKELLQQNGRLS